MARFLTAVAAALAISATGVLGLGTAQADVPINSFSALPSTTQAGGHPDVEFAFDLENRMRQRLNSECDCEDPKEIKVGLPTGLIGNPHAAPRCSAAEFASNICPADSQVGITQVEVNTVDIEAASEELTLARFIAPIFNLEPRGREPALLGFKIELFGAALYTTIGARTDSDYGLNAQATAINHIFALASIRQILWGVPADPRHDPLRFLVAGDPLKASEFGSLCDADEATRSTDDPRTVVTKCGGRPSLASNSPRTPFLQNPTTCGTPLTSTLDIMAYDRETSHADSPYPATTGCDQLSFNPSLSAKPTTTETDSASGVDVALTVPQFESPDAPSPSEIRATTVTFPKGFSINSNAADGKLSCSDREAHFGTLEEAQCPEFAKIGTLTVESAVLPGPLPGAVYIGEPLPGERYRLFLTADGFGEHVKLPGLAIPDPQTGQLVVSFQDLPQTPFQEFDLHFFGAERGVLATPTHCGSYPVISRFVPWAAVLPTQTSTQFFNLETGPGGAPCPGSLRPFAPNFKAASVGNTAGAHTPFAVNLTRPDGDQNLNGLTVTTPPGFSGTLKGIPYCPEAAINQLSNSSYSGLSEQRAPACPPASQIGTATAGAGAGSRPLYVGGKVYLAGPYKGAPLSLEVVIPAVSGPYDLGNVAVRAAIKVDPTTAQVTAISDPLPQILEGIPLRTRSILVNLDRPDFALNPTNCDPLAVNATITGNQGTQVDFTSHYQVANCANLPFEPKLALKMTGSKRRTGNPSLTAILTAAAGEANIAKTAVTLPKSELLDNAHIESPCTKVQFAASACPANSVLGFARAETPLLDNQLEGPVYLRSSSHTLPDIVADLHGQLNVVLVGRIDSVKERIRTTFERVPDVPVTKFSLSLKGGNAGLLENTENLCKAPQIAKVAMSGQNGATTNRNIKVQTPCASASRSKKRRLQRARGVR